MTETAVAGRGSVERAGSGPAVARLRLLPAALLVAAAASLHLIGDRALHVGRLYAVLGVWSAAYLWILRDVVRGARRPTFGVALAVAVALRVIALLLPPACSDDLPRYVWEGLVQHAGHNPFLTEPRNPLLADLAARHAELFAAINQKGFAAAYPPALQALFWLVTSFTTSVMAMKVLFAALDLATFAVLWRILPSFGAAPALALLHGFSPLAVLEFAAEGHNDALGILALTAALGLARGGRMRAAGVVLGVGACAKLLPLVALPFLLRESRRVLLPCVLTIVVLAAPYFAPTLDALDALTQYGLRWRANDGAYGLIHDGTAWLQAWLKAREPASGPHGPLTWWFVHGPTHTAAKLPVAVLMAALSAHQWFARRPAHVAVRNLVLGLFLLSAIVHPWYVAWLLPLITLAPSAAGLVWTLLVPLAYAALPAWMLMRRWVEPAWSKLVEYVPVWGTLIVGALAPRALNRPASGAARC